MAEGQGGDARAARWRLQVVLAQPWRLGMGSGAAIVVLASAWWLAVQALPSLAGTAIPWAVPRGLAHSALMGLGVFPPFIGGFVFTALPRWLRRPGPDAAQLVPAFGAFVLGWAVWLPGVHTQHGVAALGLALAAAGCADLARRAAALVRASAAPDRVHARLIAAALAVGAMAMAGAAAATAARAWPAALACVLSGLWGCVATVFVAAADRLVPAFDLAGRAARGHRLLALVLACCALRAAAPWLGAGMAEHVAWQALLGLSQAAAGVAILAGALAWRRTRRLRTPLVQALFLGSCWFGAAWLLAAGEAAARAAGSATPWPLGDVHALGIGAFGLLLAGMASQVCAAHGGRPGVLDRCAPWLLLVLQAAAVVRVAAALVALRSLPVLSALAWLLSLGCWALRIGREAGLPAVSRQHP